MKRRIISIIIIFILLSGIIYPTNAKKNSIAIDDKNAINEYNEKDYYQSHLKFEYVFEKPLIERIILSDESYDKVTLLDLPLMMEPDKPILPIKPVRILLPQKTVFIDYEIKATDKILLGEGYNLKFASEPIPIHNSIEEENNNIFFEKESDIKNQNSGLFPKELFANVRINTFRGYSFLTGNIQPIFYDYEKNSLYYYKKIELKINVEEANKINPYYRGCIEDKNTIITMVDNHLMVESYSNLPQKIETTSNIVSESVTYDYVIITCENLESAVGDYTFQDLIDFKIYKSLSAKIVTVEEIIKDTSYWNSNALFNDTPAIIRNFIKDAYLNWNTKYVLLGGDIDIVPCRELFFHYRSVFNDIDELIPSDLYYACLDGNYNSDEDIQWGEPSDGNNGNDVDLVAEVYIGRAPVNSWEDVSNFVRKTLSYEQTSDPYLYDVLMCGEDLESGGPWAGDAKDKIKRIIPLVYHVSTLYDRDNQPGGWTKSNLMSKINNNLHIINHFGHSNYQYAMKMSNSDIDNLRNDRYFFIYSTGCSCGGFDKDDCFGEELITDTHGCFAAVMNSRYGWYYQDDIDSLSQQFDKEFFNAIYRENKKQLGKANQDSKEDLIPFINNDAILRYCYYELTLFGDPEVSIKTPSSRNYDLEVKEIDTPTYLIPDVSVTIPAVIVNHGKKDRSNINVEFYVDGKIEDQLTIDSINANEEKNVDFDFTPVLGIHKIKVQIQSSNEDYINNDFKQQGIIVGPDLSINCIIPDPPFYKDKKVEFQVSVFNHGKIDAENVIVRLKQDNNIVDSNIISLISGESDSVINFEWTPSSCKWYDLTFEAQPVENEIETIIDNNYFTDSIFSVDPGTSILIDDDGGKDFKSITNAFLWSCPNVNFYVNPGKYYGKFCIDWEMDLIGSNPDSTFIYGYSYDSIINIISDNVKVKGFTFLEADRGIRIVDVNDCIIEDNNFLNIYQSKEIYTWEDGAISIKNSINTVLRGNYVFSTGNLNDDGFKIELSSDIEVDNNTIVKAGDGIFLDNSNNIHIHHNRIDGYAKYGAWGIRTKHNCHDNIFEHNTIYDTSNAYVIYGGENNIIQNNNILYNTLNSTYFANGAGIYICDEQDSIFKNNNICMNKKGICVYGSSFNNLFYLNNMIKNEVNARDDCNNIWNSKNMGNYWSDYDGSDDNNDGIGDIPYYIPGSGNNMDNYPMMEPYNIKNNPPVKPSKPKGPSSGKIDNSYTFTTSTTDPDDDMVQYGWDWNGDKNVDRWTTFYDSGLEHDVAHIWHQTGTYEISVKARDIYGIESEWSEPLTFSISKSKNKFLNRIFQNNFILLKIILQFILNFFSAE